MTTMSTLVERGNEVGLTRKGIEILAFITQWMNGYTVEVGGKTYHIGRSYEPELPVIFEGSNLMWTTEHADELERMRDSGIIKSAARGEGIYVAARPVRWAPTELGIHHIQNLFEGYDPVYPPNPDRFESGSPPLFGDSFESLEHRKGVLVTDTALRHINEVEFIELYPNPEKHRPRPDVFFKLFDHYGRVEVVITDDDQHRWAKKWEAWAKSNARTIYVFKNRTIAVKFFNYLNRLKSIDDDCRLKLPNGDFGGDPSNHSVDALNTRLLHARTRAGYQAPAARLALTLPTLLQRRELSSVMNEYYLKD